MNFLGIGPGELLLIFIVTLLVVGPERLPGLARQVGRGLVRVRNWMQTSPDAALVLRARQELEQELAQIRSSLLEVQSVRDEVLDVAKQIDEAVSPIASIRPPSLSELIKEPTDKPQPRTNNGQSSGELNAVAGEAQLAESIADASEPVVADETPLAESIAGASEPVAAEDGAPQAVADASEPVAAMDAEPLVDKAVDELADVPSPIAASLDAAPMNGAQPDSALVGLSSIEREEFSLRIQAIMADLNALQEQLRRRGLLDADWEPPSWSMQLPGPQPEAPIEEADR